MCILKAGWPCFISGLWLNCVCLQEGWAAANWLYGPNLQDIDYLRQQTINYSETTSVTPCGSSCTFAPAAQHSVFPLTEAHTHSPLCLFTFSVPPSPCFSHCAVLCWASGSSSVLRRRSLIQCFKKLSGRMWLISFYTKSLTTSHSLTP